MAETPPETVVFFFFFAIFNNFATGDCYFEGVCNDQDDVNVCVFKQNFNENEKG
jgi:hypothetical protein